MSRSRTLLLAAGLLAIAAGVALRAIHTTDRPLHTDEAVQAWLTWQLLGGEGYRYDAVDRHGPTLYYGAAWWTHLTGGDAESFDDFRARSFALLAGVLTLLLLWRWSAANIGAGASLAIAAFVAAMPLAAIYSTYFIQEPWLALGTWALLFAAIRWWREPTFATAVACGILAGFVQSTKETSVIHFAAAIVALFALGKPRPAPRQFLLHGGVAVAAAAVVFIAFYSSFGANPGGVLDGIKTYVHQFSRAGDEAFRQPAVHYLESMFPHRAGVWWSELGLLACSLAGIGLSLRKGAPPAMRAVAVFTLALVIVYSAIPYKTPWLFLTPALGLAVLAGFALAQAASASRWNLLVAVVIGVLTVGELGVRSERALGRFAGDARNPYFLEQPPRAFVKIVAELNSIFDVKPDARVAVVSPNHAWPLPWYLRDRETVGYFEALPVNKDDWDVRIVDSQIPMPVNWGEGAVVGYHGLRPNVLLTLIVEKPLWERVHP